MRVFITGATGAIGKRLVPKLMERGHQVIASVRSEGAGAPAARAAHGKVERLRALGAEAVVVDLFDDESVRAAVGAARPDAIIHQATALAGASDYKHFDRVFAATNRLRTRATDALVAAARAAGVGRLLVQSYTSWPYARTGGPIKTEEDPLDTSPPRAMSESLAAIRHLERAAGDANGIVLRYGAFYGAPDDPMLPLVRRRMFPVVGDGGGLWSFIHLDDAAAATALALEGARAGIYNIVDDEPAPARVWLPALAAAIGAPPPRHVPRFLARLLAGEAPVIMMTESRGASNAKAKRELGWTPRYPSWRLGFAAAYGPALAASQRPASARTAAAH